MNPLSVLSLLAFGFGLGLKHATEADHLAAVSTILSDRKSLWSASLIGGLWGLGHTISLLLAGLAVIVLHFEISAHLAKGLEFCVKPFDQIQSLAIRSLDGQSFRAPVNR